MRRLVVKVLKNETILVVASILALISCFIVPPDKEYAGYIHASTISQLICLMLVVCGFQRIGVFRIIGSRLLEKVAPAASRQNRAWPGAHVDRIAVLLRHAHHQ